MNGFLLLINSSTHWLLYWPLLLSSEGKCCTLLVGDGERSLPSLFFQTISMLPRQNAFFCLKRNIAFCLVACSPIHGPIKVVLTSFLVWFFFGGTIKYIACNLFFYFLFVMPNLFLFLLNMPCYTKYLYIPRVKLLFGISMFCNLNIN